MDMTHSFWVMQPMSVQLFLLGLLAVALISVMRFGRLASRLYRYAGRRILPENIVKGEVAPDLLAASALASRAPDKAALEKQANSGFSAEGVGAEKVLQVLRVAEIRFAYLWERCYADVESTRRASALTFLVSLVMVAYGASPTYSMYFNDSNRPGSFCLFLTAEQLLALLALGWSGCGALYFMSSFFERALADRKTSWKYLCATLRNELSRDCRSGGATALEGDGPGGETGLWPPPR